MVVLSHLANGDESIMSFNKYEGYRNIHQRPINRLWARSIDTHSASLR